MSGAQERELLAIVFTDAVNSSNRTASNEDHSINLLLEDLAQIRIEAENRGGSVLKKTGDGLLIFFKSAVDAVECALAVQKRFHLRREPGFFQHKIGVHIGDVIRKDGDIYGAGVNLASRLVSQCWPGEVCLSSALYELTKQKSEIGSLPLKVIPIKKTSPPVTGHLTNLTTVYGTKDRTNPPKKFQVLIPFFAFVLLLGVGGWVWMRFDPFGSRWLEDWKGIIGMGYPKLLEPGVEGYWQGSISPSGARLGLHLDEKAGQWIVKMDGIDQKKFDIPVQEFAFRGGTMRFSVPEIVVGPAESALRQTSSIQSNSPSSGPMIGRSMEGDLQDLYDGSFASVSAISRLEKKTGANHRPAMLTFSGALDPQRRVMRGTVDYGEDQGRFELLRISKLDGTWEGVLPAQVGGQRIVVHLHSGESEMVGKLENSDPKSFGISIPDIFWDGKKLRFGIRALGISYQGTWSGLARDKIEGVFQQADQTVPLELVRTTPYPGQREKN